MTTSLRLARIIVTLSFLVTLAWLATGDKTDWPTATHNFVCRVQSALGSADDRPHGSDRNDLSSGRSVEPRESAAQNVDQIVHAPADSPPRQVHFPDVKPSGRRDATPNELPFDRPVTDEIQLAAATAADDLTTFRRSKEAWFKLTDKSLAFLRAEEVPEAVLLKLNRLKDKEFETRQVFLGELKKILSEDELGRFVERILNHASKEGLFDILVRNKDVTVVFDLINRSGQTKIIALPSVKGPITLTLYDTTVEQALDAILKMRGYLSRKEGDYTLVYTHEDLEELDAEDGKIDVFIYKPRYIAAVDLMQVLTTHLSQKGKISSTKANQVGIAASGDNAGGDSLAVDDAIVVQDMHSAILRVKKIIDDVDVRPQQVLIEAVLLKVVLNDDHRMGVNFALLRIGRADLTVAGNGSVINGAAGFPPSTLVSAAGKVQGGFASNEHGLKYGVINGDLAGFINLLETIGHTTIVASPKVLALNKQRAVIIVGSQLGYRTVTTTETAAVENVQFLDVGTQLRMRPYIQQDGYIRMELHPEKSSGQVSETTGLPEKDTTQVTTNLTIKSCQTIVIGGLIEEQQARTVQQVPFLGSLPLVGRLFRDETTSISRTEIIVLITPRIIDDEQESANGTEEVERFSKRRDSLERSMPKYTRIALARKYYDRAREFRDAGDLKNARKMVDLALHFDPLNEPALKLWEELQSLKEDQISADAAVETPEGFRLEPVEPEGN